MVLMFCTAWLTPMAKVRNGTSTEYGSSPSPSRSRIPNCQTTASEQQNSVDSVPRQHREYQ